MEENHKLYPLVSSHITLESHQFSWVNQQIKWQFSSSQTVSLPEGTQSKHVLHFFGWLNLELFTSTCSSQSNYGRLQTVKRAQIKGGSPLFAKLLTRNTIGACGAEKTIARYGFQPKDIT